MLIRLIERPLFCCLSFLVMLLCALFCTLSVGDLRYPDEFEYHEQALRLASGLGYVDAGGRPTAYRPPGYPFVLSLLYRVVPYTVSARLFNVVALAGAAVFLAGTAYAVFPHAGGAIVPALMVMYPVVFYTASTLYPQTAGSFLMALMLYVIMTGWPWKPGLRAVTAGLVAGLLVLLIPAFAMVLPVVAVAGFRRALPGAGRGFRYGAAFVLAAMIVVLPWSLRNYLVLDRLVPVSTNSGVNLLLGNSENSGPNTGVNADISKYTVVAEGMNEAERDAYYRERAVEWVVSEPWAAFRLYVMKVLNYFNFRNELRIAAEGSLSRNVVMFATYYLLLSGSLARLLLVRRFPLMPGELFLYVIYFSNALLSAVFFTRIRFRIPFDMLLIVINSVFAGVMMRAWRQDIKPGGGE